MPPRKSLTDIFQTLSGPRLAFLALVAAGGYFLWAEHQAHILAALPYLFLLLCPLLHIFMHRGHGGHREGEDAPHQECHGEGRDKS